MAVRRRELQESKDLAVKEGRRKKYERKNGKCVREGGKEVAGKKKFRREGERGRASERGERHPRVSVFWLAVTALSAQTAGGKQ